MLNEPESTALLLVAESIIKASKIFNRILDLLADQESLNRMPVALKSSHHETK